MAKRTASGLSGLVGTVVVYEMNGQEIVRARPVWSKKKRNKNVARLNTVFGTVSTFGTRMIKAMKPELRFPFTNATYNRQRGWMRNEYANHKDDAVWELVAKNNMMSQLNPGSDLRDLVDFNISIVDEGNGIIGVLFPAFKPSAGLKVPYRTKRVNFRILVSTSPFKENGIPCNLYMDQYQFDHGSDPLPEKKISIPVKNSSAGDIAIVVLALEFETGGTSQTGYNTEAKWLPAAIVAMGRLQ